MMNGSGGVGSTAQSKMPGMGNMMGQPGFGGFGMNPFMFPQSQAALNGNNQPQKQGVSQSLNPLQASI